MFGSTKDYFDIKRKLVCFVRMQNLMTIVRRFQDMDSCLLANECIDEMAHVYGKGAEVSAITHRFVSESLSFLV